MAEGSPGVIYKEIQAIRMAEGSPCFKSMSSSTTYRRIHLMCGLVYTKSKYTMACLSYICQVYSCMGQKNESKKCLGGGPKSGASFTRRKWSEKKGDQQLVPFLFGLLLATERGTGTKADLQTNASRRNHRKLCLFEQREVPHINAMSMGEPCVII